MTQSRVPQIPALTGIRIIAAMWVVIEHFRFVIFGLFPETKAAHVVIESGYLGVEVFFVLSGFIISHNYAERFRTFSLTGYGGFLRNRLARLYPVHLVSFGVVGLLVVAASASDIELSSEGKYDVLNFIMNLLMLQAVPPAQAWNGPAWSISAEAGAYLIFPLIVIALVRIQRNAWLLAMIGIALALTVGGQFLLEATGSFAPTGYASIALRIFGEFAAGCFLWRFWSKAVTPSKRYDCWAVFSLVGVIAVLVWLGGTSAASFLTLPFIVLFILSAASSSGVVRTFLSSRIMDYGGRISYSLYMVHFLVLMIGGKLLPWEKYEGAPWTIRLGTVIAYLGASLLLSGLVYRYIEVPGRRTIVQAASKAPLMNVSIHQ